MNMKKLNKTIFVALFIFFALDMTAQIFYIQGGIKSKGRALENVNVSLMSNDTTRFLSGINSDDKGFFKLTNISKGSYVLRCSMVGYRDVYRAIQVNQDENVDVIQMMENNIELDQVVVTAKMLNTYGNREEILLTEQERGAGSSALEVIGKLSQFSVNQLNNQLKTINQQDLLITINGRRASSQELMSLTPDNIRKIVYYTSPPARYADLNVGGVLEVTTKRSVDKNITLFLNTKNSFTTGYGTDMLSMSYADSLNRITGTYFIDYRALNDNENEQTFEYLALDNRLKNVYDGLPGKYIGRYHIGQLQYERNFRQTGILNMVAQYRKNPGKERYSQSYASSQAGKPSATGLNSRDLNSDYDAMSLDVYLSKEIKNNHTFTLDVVNTYFLSASDNLLQKKDEHEIVYSLENKFRNNSYSLLAEALYTIKNDNSELSFGGKYSLKTLKQIYDNNRTTKFNNQSEYLYADYSSSMGEAFNYNVGCGIEYLNYHGLEKNKVYGFLTPKPYVSLSYNFSKASTASFYTSFNSNVPTMGMLVENPVYIDEYYMSKGNSKLKPYYTYYNRLKYQLSAFDGKIFFMPSVSHTLSMKPTMPMLYEEDGWIVRMDNPFGNKNQLTFDAVVKLTPFKWLSVQPYYAFNYYGYNTSFDHVRFTDNRWGLMVQLDYKSVQGVFNWMNRGKTPNGVFYEEAGAFFYSSVKWNFKDMTLGAEYNYSPHPSKQYANTPLFKMNEEIVWNNFRHLLAVTYTYYFSTGKSKKFGQKKLSNQDYDSGLIKDNIAK